MSYKRSLGFLVAVVLMLVPSLPKPVRADALDTISSCVNAYTGYKSLAELGIAAADPEFLECSSQIASGDVVLTATVVAIVGAGAAGAFDSKAECNDMITGQIGKTIAQILTKAPGVSDALKALLGSHYQQLVDFAAGQGVESITSIQGIDQVFRYMRCGCAIYGKGQAAAAIAKGYVNDVKECAGFVGDVAEAVLDGLESGADAVGEFLGGAAEDVGGAVADAWNAATHWIATAFKDAYNWLTGKSDPPPVREVRTETVLDCSTWQEFSKPATIIELGDGGTKISHTDVTRNGNVITVNENSCSCYAPSILEKPLDQTDGKLKVRCGCREPAGGVYNTEARTCGCKPTEKLDNGTCVPCDTPKFSSTGKETQVEYGQISGGVCQPVVQSCPADQKLVLAKGGYHYYQCQPICAAGTFYVQSPNAAAGSGQCSACPANFVPDKDGLKSGVLQCNECPARTSARPGDRFCTPLDCANGVDPDNLHRCKPACRMVGVGSAKRLVCDGGILDQSGGGITCPPRFRKEGGKCVPEVYHKPDDGIPLHELGVPKTKPNVIDRKRKPKNDGSGGVEGKVDGRVDKRRNDGPVLLGPVDDGANRPSAGDLLNLGIGIGNMLDLGSGSSGSNSAQEALPQSDGTTRRQRVLPLPEETAPTYIPHSKD